MLLRVSLRGWKIVYRVTWYRGQFFAQHFTRQHVASFWNQVKNSQRKMTNIQKVGSCNRAAVDFLRNAFPEFLPLPISREI